MKQNIGFTLIELMIVISFVGILAALVSNPAYRKAECKKQGMLDCDNIGKKGPPQPSQNVICISGYKFLSDSKTQILNANGGGVPCNTFN